MIEPFVDSEPNGDHRIKNNEIVYTHLWFISNIYWKFVNKILLAYLSFEASVLRENLRVFWDVSEKPATSSSSPVLATRRHIFEMQQPLQLGQWENFHITQFLAPNTRHTQLILRLVAPTYLAEMSQGEECVIIPFLFTTNIEFTECDGNLWRQRSY